jgi:serine/threonine-protein kinase
LLFLGVVLAFMLLLVLFNWVVMPLVVGRGRETVVPQVVGMDRFAAEETLLKRGLSLGQVRSVPNAAVPVDRVVSQMPEPGRTVKLGRKVQLDVSRGGSRLRVPTVRGLTVAKATTLLAQAGLSVAAVESVRVPNLPLGQVVGTRPPAGEELLQGEPVIIQVCSRTGRFPMPALVGLTLTAARSVIAAQGLIMGQVRDAPSDEPAGNVLVQYPEEGMTVRDGDTVSVIVATREGR